MVGELVADRHPAVAPAEDERVGRSARPHLRPESTASDRSADVLVRWVLA